MERHSAPLLRKLATIVSGDLREAVEETTSNWEETLALILTYAREEEFVSLCQQLSARLERLGLRDAALLCSVCAVDVSSLLRLGLQDADGGVRAHLSVMEALLILCSMVSPQDLVFSEDAASVGATLATLCVELQRQGMNSVARFLQVLRSATSAQSLVRAVAGAEPELFPGFQMPVEQPVVEKAPVKAQELFAAPAPVSKPVASKPVTPVTPKPFMPTMPVVQPTMQPMTQPVTPTQPLQPTVEKTRPMPFLPVATLTPQPTAPVAPAEPAPAVEYE